MAKVTLVDVSTHSIDMFSDFSMAQQKREPGPPERVNGMTMGIVTMTEDAPHGGEVHPDGDELLYVISGRLQVTTESNPEEALFLGPGQACIVPKGEWH